MPQKKPEVRTLYFVVKIFLTYKTAAPILPSIESKLLSMGQDHSDHFRAYNNE
jgi:hypothetical protein